MIEVVSTFQQRFNEALQIRDIKPVDIAKRTGISESTISQYRSGYAKPKQDKLAILSNALHVNPVWLMGYDVPMERQKNTPIEPELNEGEKMLLSLFRQVPVESQQMVLDMIKIALKQHQ